MSMTPGCIYCEGSRIEVAQAGDGRWRVVCSACGAAGPLAREAGQAWQAWHRPINELRLLHTVADASPDIVLLKDEAGRFLYGNQALADLYGTTAAALVGKDDSAFNPNAEQVAFYRQTLQEVMREGRTQLVQEASTDAATGETRYYQSIKKPLMGPDGQPCVLVVATDVTQLRRAHREIEAREKSYTHAMNAAGDAIWDWDIPRDTITHNAKWSEVLGFEVEMQRHPVSVFAELIHEDDREATMQAVQAALAGNGSYEHEHRMVRRDGQVFWAHDRGAVVERDAAGRPTRMAGAFTDITQRKRIESQLIEMRLAAQAANRAKSEFLANMSHEIRTPLNAVLGMVYLLRQTALDIRQRGYLVNIDASTRLLLGIINDILDYSKIESGRIELESENFTLSGILKTVGTLACTAVREQQVDVLFRLDPSVPDWLRGDALRLQQILINLVGNAIKFTTSGEVTLEIGMAWQETGRLGLKICVADTGIGMTQEQLERLFQPFTQAESSTTRRFGGTGLGLVITKRLVSLMEGEIQASSEPGRGSTFTVLLPFGLPPAAAPAAVFPPRKLALAVTNPVSRAADQALCGQLGWEVAPLEEEALVQRISAAGGTTFPHDLVMWAIRADGDAPDCLERFLNAGARSPAFLLLGNPENARLAGLAARHKRVAILARPYTRGQLAEAVEALFAQAEPAACENLSDSEIIRGMRILAAEDSLINQIVIQEILELAGATVSIVENGLACVSLIAQSPASFDLVLMDMHMPEMDGVEATRRLRQMGCCLPIVALTASTQESDKEACREAGMNAFISKPVDPDELISLLSAYHPDKAAPPEE